MLKVEKLKNGLNLLLVPKEGSRTAAILLVVKSGTRHEAGDNSGIAHFLEHLVLCATKSRPNQKEIFEYLDEIGANYNAFTGHEYTGFHADFAKEHLARGIDYISELYTCPLFNQSDFERERKVIKTEIDYRDDMPLYKASVLFYKALFGNSPVARKISGTKETLDRMTVDEIKNFYEKNYQNDNSLMIIVADPQTLKQAKNLCQKVPPRDQITAKDLAPSEALKTGPRVSIAKKDINQANVIIGFEGPAFGSPDRPAMVVLSTLLGGMASSRAYLELRDKQGLCYDVRSSLESHTDTGSITLDSSIAPENLTKAIEAMLGEFSKLKKEPILKSELIKTKQFLKGQETINFEDPEEIADFYGFHWSHHGDLLELDEMLKLFDAVSEADILKVANKYLQRETLTAAIVAPQVNESKIQEILNQYK